jgi:hypothetical protein
MGSRPLSTEADKLDLVDPEALRAALDGYTGQPGVVSLRHTLDRRTFTMTDTELERRFLPIARRVGLPLPHTQVRVNRFEVDSGGPSWGWWWRPTVSATTERRPSRRWNRLKDQTHTAAGVTPLRFTRAQVKYEPGYVREILAAVARRLRR